MSPIAGSDFKTQVLEKTDIVQLIGQSVGLKRRGKDFWGLCPFHGEKSPSFKVDPGKQFFYCFGCKENGNAIDFVMKRDRVAFVDALRALGQQAGLEMPQHGGSREKSNEKQQLLDAHAAAATFFESWLAHPTAGAPAREYLAQRGFTPETIKRFRLGVAVDAWDALLRSNVARKFPPPLLAAGGLAKARENNGGFYDTFRNRLMFPIRDETGRTIAFGGRVMPGSQDPAKYLNSPETPLFSKSRSIYGLDLAKQRIVETRTAVVVEGYTDVVMAHQFGASNVVAILGTGMTEQHLNLLRRFADRIVLLFDPDSAGAKAVERVVELYLGHDIELAVASMPEGVDPDEFLIQHGAAAFEQVVAGATDVLTYQWKALNRQFASDAGDLTGQQKAVKQYLELLAGVRGSGPVDSIRWGQALARVSRLTEIPIEDLNRQFKPAKSNNRRPLKQKSESLAQAGDGNVPTNDPPGPPAVRLPAARVRAEQWLLGILLLEPKRWHAAQAEVSVEIFRTPDTAELLSYTGTSNVKRGNLY